MLDIWWVARIKKTECKVWEGNHPINRVIMSPCNQFNNERVKDANSNTKISAYFLESAFDYWHFFDDLFNQNILSFVMHFPYTSKVMFWKLWYLKKADLIILLTNLSQLSFAAPTNPILCLLLSIFWTVVFLFVMNWN